MNQGGVSFVVFITKAFFLLMRCKGSNFFYFSVYLPSFMKQNIPTNLAKLTPP